MEVKLVSVLKLYNAVYLYVRAAVSVSRQVGQSCNMSLPPGRLAVLLFTAVLLPGSMSATGGPPVQAYAIDRCWINGFRDIEAHACHTPFHKIQ